MKLEKNEKVFYMRTDYGKISESGTRTIQDVEQVNGYIYVTLDNGTYFQIRPIDKDEPFFTNSIADNICEFMCEDTHNGRKYIKHHLRMQLECVFTQLGKLYNKRDNLQSLIEDNVFLT